MAEIQGAHSELLSCHIAGRRTDEARAGYEAVMTRAEKTLADMSARVESLRLAIARAEANVPVALKNQ